MIYVKSTSKLKVEITLIIKTFLFLCFYSNFDGPIIDIILMQIFDSTCFFWCVFFFKSRRRFCPLLISFQCFINESRLAVSFRCNLISMYFFKVISFHFEISYVIMKYLHWSISAMIICPQSQWFSDNILWKFAGNGHRSHPLSVSYRFLKASMRVFSFQ